MKHYIKATGSVCYDGTGITFPRPYEVDFGKILKKHKISDADWIQQFGWNNQPEVLVFSAKSEVAKLVEDALPSGLIVVEHWDVN
jgi:hypothetical protein